MSINSRFEQVKKQNRKMRSTKKFRTPYDMEQAINKYFDGLTTTKPALTNPETGEVIVPEELIEMPPTVAGLAYALGLSRTDILNYGREAGYEQYHNVIKRARERIMIYLEQRMHLASKPTGALFLLKNMGKESLSDKQEISVVDEVAKMKLKYQQDADDLLANARRGKGSDSNGSGK